MDPTDKQLLVLAVLSAALVFLPMTIETALLHWNTLELSMASSRCFASLGSGVAGLAWLHLRFWKKRKKAGYRP